MKKQFLKIVTLALLVSGLSSCDLFGDKGSANTANYIEITTASDLIQMNKSSSNYKLINDIVIPSDEWTPITEFTGILEGNNYSISNIKISSLGVDGLGFFGNLKGGTVKNLTLKDVNITGSNAGGLVGKSSLSTVIDNVSVYGTVGKSIGYNIGGIVGYTEPGITMTNCTNYATVLGGETVGGVVGYSAKKVSNSNAMKSTFKNLTNKGNVNGVEGVGGIIGAFNQDYEYGSSVELCKNDGVVMGTDGVGGIVGGIEPKRQSSTNIYVNITSCENRKSVEGITKVGGILGAGGTFLDTISNCENYGKVTGSEEVGGIGGWVDHRSYIENCSNAANISGKVVLGGIVGSGGNISNCQTTSGYSVNTTGGSVSVTSTNGPKYDNGTFVGGIAGYGNEIIGCTNNMNVTSNNSTSGTTLYCIGGVAGLSIGNLKNNINNGKVNIDSTSDAVGGVSGRHAINLAGKDFVVQANQNKASVTGGKRVGGLIGYFYNFQYYAGGWKYYYNKCTVVSNENRGDITGLSGETAGLIAHAAAENSKTAITLTSNANYGNITSNVGKAAQIVYTNSNVTVDASNEAGGSII